MSIKEQSSLRMSKGRFRWCWLCLIVAFSNIAVVSGAPSPYQWISLAERGQFDRLRQRLEQQPDAEKRPLIRSLDADLKRYAVHKSHFQSERHKAYLNAIEKMNANLKAGHLEDALVSAVNAQSQLDTPSDIFHNSHIQNLIAEVEASAGQRDLTGDWLTALSLYRSLEILYEPKPRYKKRIDQLVQRVRVIGLYAPKRLQKLYEARAKVIGQSEVPPLALGQETWQTRLVDVNLSILTSALRNAALRHLSSPGYRKLILGSLDGLLTMIQTAGVEEAFPQLAKPNLHRTMVQGLQQISKRVQTEVGRMNHAEVATTLQEIFDLNRRTVSLPESVLIYELTEGAMGQLDPFSAVIWPYEVDQFNRNTSGLFFGVGIQIAMTNSRLTVVSPLPGTPAYHAGIRPGDMIFKVNGKDTTNWTLDWAVKEITGPRGTVVRLGIKRKGEKDLLTFNLTRAKIKIQSVRGWRRKPDNPTQWDYYLDRSSQIGYIRVSQFIPQTPTDFDAAINEMDQDMGIKGLILDLRFNPGGLLRKSAQLANRFIREGTLVSTVDAQGQITSQFTARRHLTHAPIPTVVLVNQGSASAAEIVSGALQDHQAALIVGTRTFGKGSVQDLYQLNGSRAQLKLTTQHYQLPLGRDIHRKPGATRWGVEPDLSIKMTDQEVAAALEFRQKVDVLHENDGQKGADASAILKEGMDLQLEAAVLILKTRQAADAQVNLVKKPLPVRTP